MFDCLWFRSSLFMLILIKSTLVWWNEREVACTQNGFQYTGGVAVSPCIRFPHVQCDCEKQQTPTQCLFSLISQLPLYYTQQTGFFGSALYSVFIRNVTALCWSSGTGNSSTVVHLLAKPFVLVFRFFKKHTHIHIIICMWTQKQGYHVVHIWTHYGGYIISTLLGNRASRFGRQY